MKITIGSNIIDGPWGGGNQFARSLSKYLKEKGWEVTSGLSDEDIDIILMTEPRITSKSSAYNQRQISRYLIRNPKTMVVHRINECDERKGTRGVNKYLMRANKVADHTIFISSFLRNLFIEKKLFKNKKISSIVRNGADEEIFNRKGLKKWDKKSPLKLVTHHWGFNYNKGLDIYKKLARINSIGKIKIEFNYIGRVPEKERDNIRVITPLSGKALAEKLKTNHIYVSGSINEPGGMHHIEGAMCGLPILLRNSGALSEHCSGFGEMFEGVEDFIEKLKKIIKKYDYYYNKIIDYPYNSELMCKEYEKIFLNIIKQREFFNDSRRQFINLFLFSRESILFTKDIIILKIRGLMRRFNFK